MARVRSGVVCGSPRDVPDVPGGVLASAERSFWPGGQCGAAGAIRTGRGGSKSTATLMWCRPAWTGHGRTTLSARSCACVSDPGAGSARRRSDLGRNPDQIVPRFQLRDPRIEAVAWAIKANLEADAPSDRLYAKSLGLALASRLVDPGLQPGHTTRQTLTVRQRRLLVEYIDANLDQSLSLRDLAAVAGLSVSHLKTLFGNTFGLPVHRYVVRCRVDRARMLLLSGDLPMSQVALAAGFADQSHMANCMRRVLGLTPGAIARQRV